MPFLKLEAISWNLTSKQEAMEANKDPVLKIKEVWMNRMVLV